MLDEHVIEALRKLFAEQSPMPVTFGECRRREGFVYLRPDPVEGLEEELTSRARQRWPKIVPYEGATRTSSRT
jgi:hypothetical protein